MLWSFSTGLQIALPAHEEITMIRGKLDPEAEKKARFSLGIGVTIVATIAVGMIMMFFSPFDRPAPKKAVPPATLEQAEPEVAEAITGIQTPEPEIAAPESIQDLSTEVLLQPGAPVGMQFAPMQKADDVPNATGTRADIDGHVFYRRNMMWYEAGYDGTMGPSIEVGSDAANALIAREPYFERVMKLGPIVSAKVDGKWCFFHSVRSQ